MSAFTPTEIEHLSSQSLARLATVGPDGQRHVVPVTFVFNAEEDAIDIGGVDFGTGTTPAAFRASSWPVGQEAMNRQR